MLTLAKKALRATAWGGLRALTRANAFSVLVPLYERAIQQIDANGRLSPPRPTLRGEFTILVLSAEQYRKDPQILAGQPGIRVLVLEQRWQMRLLFQFFEQGHLWEKYMNPPPGSDLERQKASYRRFLGVFLPRLYERLSIDCLVSPHVHYYSDADIGAVSDALGYPYVVLHRENLAITKPVCDMIATRLGRIRSFEGSLIVVHNDAMRDVMTSAGFVDPERIKALGCTRMDSFVRSCAAAKPPQNATKRILFFPFHTGSWFPEKVRSFFVAVHATLVRYAMARPEVEVLIKPKPKFESTWRRDFDRAMRESGLRPETVWNLKIDSGGDAQALIFRSDVVTGVQTTTVLEAGVAGRPVVVPYFRDIEMSEFNDGVMFRSDSSDCFDIAHDPEEYRAMLDKALLRPTLAPEKREAVRRVFSRFVSDLEGQATDKYVRALRATVSAAAPRRAAVSERAVKRASCHASVDGAHDRSQ